jgi:hypothetical protein
MKIRAFAWGLMCAALALGGLARTEEVEATEVVSYATFIRAHPYEQTVISQAGALAVSNIAEQTV